MGKRSRHKRPMQERLERRQPGATGAPATDRARSPRLFRAVLLVCVLAILVYLNGIPGEFVFDDKLIQRDARIHGETSFWTIFVTDYWYGFIGSNPGLYRPLTIASYALNFAVSGLSSPAFHAVNIVLHAAVCGLLVLFVEALFGDRRLAVVTGLLFAAHPVHTEAVTSIVGRAEILTALFLLVSLYLHARDYVLGRWRESVWVAVALAAYFCALLSKETAIVGPGLLLLVDYVKRVDRAPAPGGTSLRRVIGLLGLYWGVAAVYLIIRYEVLGQFLQDPPAKAYYLLFGQPVATRIFTGLKILAVYLRLLIVPLTLSADYSYRQVPFESSLGSVGAVVGVAAAVGLGGSFVWALRRRALPAVFAVGFFAVAYSVVSNLLVPIGVLVAERLMYLPSVGFCMGLAWLWGQLSRQQAGLSSATWLRRLAVAILAAVLLFYGGRTFVRNFDWWNPETLYAATARASPDCHAAHFNYAAVLMRNAGDTERMKLALRHLRQAHEIRADHYPSLVNMSILYLHLGQPEEGLEMAKQGLEVRPDSKKLRGIMRTLEGRLHQRKKR